MDTNFWSIFCLSKPKDCVDIVFGGGRRHEIFLDMLRKSNPATKTFMILLHKQIFELMNGRALRAGCIAHRSVHADCILC